jgi:two-component system, chemotaxis family, CheB/CheR fusion protein
LGIGASAGGLEALQIFFKNLPPDTNAAYVVVQHLSPDYKSMMDELLARYTNMPIQVIKDGIKVEANTIYLIPPRQNLEIFNDHLFLTNLPGKGLNLPIDIFFRSLAEEKGKRRYWDYSFGHGQRWNHGNPRHKRTRRNGYGSG